MAGQILEKPPELRNVNDIKILAKCMSAVEFFKKYDINTTEACLKHMYYVSMKQSEKVFEIGIDAFYYHLIYIRYCWNQLLGYLERICISFCRPTKSSWTG